MAVITSNILILPLLLSRPDWLWLEACHPKVSQARHFLDNHFTTEVLNADNYIVKQWGTFSCSSIINEGYYLESFFWYTITDCPLKQSVQWFIHRLSQLKLSWRRWGWGSENGCLPRVSTRDLQHWIPVHYPHHAHLLRKEAQQISPLGCLLNIIDSFK